MNENPSLFGNAQLQIELKTLAAVEAGTVREPPAPYKTPKGEQPERRRAKRYQKVRTDHVASHLSAHCHRIERRRVP